MTRQALDNHISRFQLLMNEKGYDGHFLCNAGYPGKLKESLTQHLLDTLQGSTTVPPFFLTTYSRWQDEESPYVKCDFKVKYNQSDGFHIDKMEITQGNQYGKIKSITLPIVSNAELPSRLQANRKVQGNERILKIR